MSDPRKKIFDAIRAAAPTGTFNDAGNVLAVDNLLDALGVARAGASTPAGRMRTSDKGIALLHEFEGCRLTAYPDPGTGGDPWTIGWGTTRINGRPIPPGTKITQARADELFREQLVQYEADVLKAIGDTPTTQAQFDALVSFHYNTGAISRASLMKQHRAGAYGAAAAGFAAWNRAGGRVMAGLTRRRAAEAKMYRGQV